jgi:DNA-binding response OmpR family regulator
MADLLIVDDDARIVELTTWFLEQGGHQVRSALSYAAARIELTRRVPDLLLADLELGAESGREELPRLYAEGVLPPTLVISGFLDAELQLELNAIPGVVGTLSKPVDPDALEERIAACLERAIVSPQPPVAEPTAPDDLDDGWVEIVPLDPPLDQEARP